MIDEQTLHERLTDAASAQDGALPRSLQEDLTAGRRRLFRRRLLTGASSAVAVAGVAVAAVGLSGPLHTAARHEAPAANHNATQDTSQDTSQEQTTANPAAHDLDKLIRGLLVKHLDPDRKHLDFSTGLFEFAPGEATVGIENKVGWKVPGDAGEGMLEIGLTRSNQQGNTCGSVNEGVTCHRVTLPNGRPAMIGHRGKAVELSYVQPDGETAFVAMNPLFGNNSTIPLKSMPITDAQLIAFVTDPALNLPPVTTADRERALRLAMLAPYRTGREQTYADMLAQKLQRGQRRIVLKIGTSSGLFQLELTIDPSAKCQDCRPVTLPDTGQGKYAEGVVGGKYVRTAFYPTKNLLVRIVYSGAKPPSDALSKAEMLMLACDPLLAK
ncbi:hypothetical protein AB0E69_23780 [Kribbella sp. NPDC026611]|uniref:hypothetical protein n=1 Tax=Kribbella sp. NPDC026611 TaxID=3154911 RepID=UPI0033FCE53A